MNNKLTAMVVPILPNKTEAVRNYFKELNGKWKKDFRTSRQQAGIRTCQFLQQTPMGDFVIVVSEGENPVEAGRKIWQAKNEFTKWAAQQIKENCGVDVTNLTTGTPPELAIDSGNPKVSGETFLAMAVPVLPNKAEAFKSFAKELNGKRKEEFKASRQKLGVHERTFLQHTPMGDFVIPTFEGENPGEALKKLGEGKDEFTKWFAASVKEINGVDLATITENPIPELLVDSGRVMQHA